jgi:hypothetical protein
VKKRLLSAGLAGILSLALVGCDDPDDGVDDDLDTGGVTETTTMTETTVPLTPTTAGG